MIRSDGELSEVTQTHHAGQHWPVVLITAGYEELVSETMCEQLFVSR